LHNPQLGFFPASFVQNVISPEEALHPVPSGSPAYPEWSPGLHLMHRRDRRVPQRSSTSAYDDPAYRDETIDGYRAVSTLEPPFRLPLAPPMNRARPSAGKTSA